VPRPRSQPRNSGTGTLPLIATWWRTARQSVRSGVPRASSVRRSSPCQPRAGRVRDVADEREDAIVSLLVEPVVVPSTTAASPSTREHIAGFSAAIRRGAPRSPRRPRRDRARARAPPRGRTAPSRSASPFE
jgi:hypothetical protein